jgi:hypothetical protein
VIKPVWIEKTGFDVIGEISWYDNFEKLSPKFEIEDGKNDFDSAMKIAWHKIGAAEIDVRVSTVGKNIDSAVFEKTVDDTSDGDVLTEARNPWAQAANPADQKLDWHPFLGGLVEGLNNFFVYKGVGLNENTGGTTCTVVGAFTLNEFEEICI